MTRWTVEYPVDHEVDGPDHPTATAVTLTATARTHKTADGGCRLVVTGVSVPAGTACPRCGQAGAEVDAERASWWCPACDHRGAYRPAELSYDRGPDPRRFGPDPLAEPGFREGLEGTVRINGDRYDEDDVPKPGEY